MRIHTLGWCMYVLGKRRLWSLPDCEDSRCTHLRSKERSQSIAKDGLASKCTGRIKSSRLSQWSSQNQWRESGQLSTRVGVTRLLKCHCKDRSLFSIVAWHYWSSHPITLPSAVPMEGITAERRKGTINVRKNPLSRRVIVCMIGETFHEVYSFKATEWIQAPTIFQRSSLLYWQPSIVVRQPFGSDLCSL